MSTIEKPTELLSAINDKTYPTITMWNRLEGRPRTHNFDKALKAEVRDALWMLSKQWQMGEFTGEDTGSPVFSKISIETSDINKYSPGNHPDREIADNIPLETLVEQKKIPMSRQGEVIALDIRMQLGRYWHKLLKSRSLEYCFPLYLESYGFILPARSRDSDYIYANKAELRQWMAISGRCIDGYKIVSKIAENISVAENIALTNPDHEVILNELGEKLITYFKNNFVQPEEDNAWLPDRMEYKLSCSGEAGGDKDILTADEYYQGSLDWFSFKLKTERKSNTISKDIYKDTFIPTHVEFDGMPDTRWWKFEDSKTSFGDISPATTDISKLILIEFGLTFANDWFLLPFELPIGAIAEIKGLTVTNNFGDTFWIDSTEKGSDNLTDWSMFRQTSSPVNKKIFLCPSAAKVQEGKPLEEIWLIRDEMANMVWGVEKTIASSLGKGIEGTEYALQKRKFHESFVSPPIASDYVADTYYRAMSEVPENWIPFIPVHAQGHKRKVQLQRGTMLRVIDGDSMAPTKVKPLTSLMREGLEAKPVALPYLVHEEEITRAGTRLTQAFQRTRWLNGEVFVWLGAKKTTGRGEGNSGLEFDQLAASPKV